MSKRHFNPSEQLIGLSPEDMGMVYTSAKRIELLGNSVKVESCQQEMCLVCIGGSFWYKYGEKSGEATLRDIIYLPVDSNVTLESENGIVAQFSAPCTNKTKFAHIKFSDIDGSKKHQQFGKKETSSFRNVWHAIDDSFDSGRFLVGFCKGMPGGWTAWPPHEHSIQREETYVFFDMGSAFGVQLVYDEMEDPYNVELVLEGDLVSIPRGYHPNCGCPGGQLSYLYCMVSTTEGDRQFMDLKTQEIFGDRLE